MWKIHNYILSALFAIIALGALIGAFFFGAWHQLFIAFMAACMALALHVEAKKGGGVK